MLNIQNSSKSESNTTSMQKVQTTSVYCNGKAQPYDHPLVYLEIDIKNGKTGISCPYCSKKFILNEYS